MLKRKTASVVVGSLILMGAYAAPAHATDTPAADPNSQHCVGVLSLTPEGDYIDATLTDEVCAPTPEGVLEEAANEFGFEAEELHETPADAASARDGNIAARAQWWSLATIYEHANFGGASYTFVVNNNNACGSGPIRWNDLTPIGWDQRISSFQGNVCRLTLFSEKNGRGSAWGPFWASAYLSNPGWNDLARSAQAQS